jgi:hypothetical protein
MSEMMRHRKVSSKIWATKRRGEKLQQGESEGSKKGKDIKQNKHERWAEREK